MASVIAAIDLGPSSRRVLLHAAGLSRLLDARLRVLHVDSDTSTSAHDRIRDYFTQNGPYEIDPGELDIALRSGHVSEAIYREAKHEDAALIVMGSRGRTSLTSLILGSTTAAVLQNAPAPVLVVPPVDLDIVSIADKPVLACGPVLVPIDLADACDHQLRFASDMAAIARQPLLLMTVAPRGVDDHDAGVMLRERAHNSPRKPRATIVRRGSAIAEEISSCARAEGAGLVVMGLRPKGRGQPGAIASAVLATRRAFVLAVPSC